ncbi:MAG: ribosomal protein L7/L12 [Candidatus Shikimatogenerans bostrichidophilus]|nr:MAG: ribosomal protein L7/L12 [Candidatus Shikimatogenerans bostrichidophilus]
MKNNLKELAKNLVNLKIKDINKLSKILKDKYNIKENNININQNKIINNNKENKENLNNNIKKKKEKSIVNIYLKSVGNIKLPVIKLIKTITGLSLIESKKIIDNIPSLIKKSIKLEEAKKIQENFKKIDAIIEIK